MYLCMLICLCLYLWNRYSPLFSVYNKLFQTSFNILCVLLKRFHTSIRHNRKRRQIHYLHYYLWSIACSSDLTQTTKFSKSSFYFYDFLLDIYWKSKKISTGLSNPSMLSLFEYYQSVQILKVQYFLWNCTFYYLIKLCSYSNDFWEKNLKIFIQAVSTNLYANNVSLYPVVVFRVYVNLKPKKNVLENKDLILNRKISVMKMSQKFMSQKQKDFS